MSPLSPAFLFLLATFLAADGTLATAITRRTSSIQWVDCASNVPSTLLAANYTLPSSLPSTLACGRLDVPMDYSQPMTDNNTITLGFSMYRPENPQALLNFNPGGPAEEVSSFAWQVALNLTDAYAFAGLESFDFLAMDVRGTYSSNPLNCSLEGITLPSGIPSTAEDFASYQALATQYAQSCIELSTPTGILAHMATTDTIQDWNSVRDALGYDTMDYLGVSYGSFGGANYANKYPEHTGRFVLDAIFPPGLGNTDLVTFQTAALNRLLLRADAYCADFDGTCPFNSQGKGSVVSAFSTVLNNAHAGAYGNVTADDVRAMTYIAYMNGNPNFQAFNQALFAASNLNDTSGFDYSTIAAEYTAGFFVVLPIICLDEHIDDNTFGGFQAMREAAALADTYNMSYIQDATLIALCGGWPLATNNNGTGQLPTNTSLLLVTSDFDLNTPTESSNFEWTQAPNSIFVVRHGDDHGTISVPGPARDAEIEFLTTGSVSPSSNESLATVNYPGDVRAAIPDPYAVPPGTVAGDVNINGTLV
ncbi:uncharacterized protein STEHIDRAFT_165026 [Stereum hirsutum FP-91666 SS1]|uniref:uncharacterized protein n=1 Tax=Stereum hirsutum (strain FP-91666) TaxID=721885 RepID=UPI000440C8D3|nr:uncharacterized protein STEHIDRAFT_165026 [Stereum hirsutum FP-91666 SS1]EIM92815.1 hypothetical protein STEHIDRAFT_165026 [Stereum hirsutum FP-91666 SS1]